MIMVTMSRCSLFATIHPSLLHLKLVPLSCMSQVFPRPCVYNHSYSRHAPLVDKSLSPAIPVYIDGACLANGTSRARGGIGVYFGPNDSRNISEALFGEPQTNQRAEIAAALKGLDLVDPSQDVVMYSDSLYVIKSMTVWINAWIRDGWMSRTTGNPIKNRDLLSSLYDKIKSRSGKTIFIHVAGHSGDPGNDAADSLAMTAAKGNLNI